MENNKIGVHSSRLEYGWLTGLTVGKEIPEDYIPILGDDFGLYDIDDPKQTVVAYGVVTYINMKYGYVELTTQDTYYTILRGKQS